MAADVAESDGIQSKFALQVADNEKMQSFLISQDNQSFKLACLGAEIIIKSLKLQNGGLHSAFQQSIHGDPLTWSTHIVEAVRHEMYPFMASSLQAALQRLSGKVPTFDKTSVDRVIDSIKKHKSMSNAEIQYMRHLVHRAAGICEDDPIC